MCHVGVEKRNLNMNSWCAATISNHGDIAFSWIKKAGNVASSGGNPILVAEEFNSQTVWVNVDP